MNHSDDFSLKTFILEKPMQNYNHLYTLDLMKSYYGIYPIDEESCRFLKGNEVRNIHTQIFSNEKYKKLLKRMKKQAYIKKHEWNDVLLLITALEDNNILSFLFFSNFL